MSFLARFRILPKIFSVIVILSAIAALIATVGVNALGALNAMTTRMERMSSNAVYAQAASVNLITMNRLEFQLIVDPSDENRRKLRTALNDEIGQFEDMLQRIAATANASPTVREYLPQIEPLWKGYKEALGETSKAADAVRDFQNPIETVALKATIMSNLESAREIAQHGTQLLRRLEV
jgi:hypothetical protein